MGNLTSKTDAEGRVTTYTYDQLNRLVSVEDADGGWTRYAYDRRDNLIRLTDAENHTTGFAYDRNNRLVKETRPMGQETAYGYDGAGNLIEKIDAKNQRTGYLYDDAGRLDEIRYYGADDHAMPVKTVTFSYDNAGNLTGYDDGTTSAVYDYDDADRKVTETVHYPGFSLSHSYTYFKNSLKETFTGPDGIPYGYLYDDNNQLTGVQIPDVGMFSVNQYQWNRPATETLPGGSQRQYEYDPLMRVQDITSLDPGQNQQLNYGYTYDKVDNITAKQTEHGDYTYQYDDLYRLTDTDNPDQADESFDYDAVGNRLNDAATTGDWTYNANNELEGYDNVSFQYDANGNLIEKNAAGAVTRFFYNLEDRLERVEDGSGSIIATYYYDPFGRRLWKDVSGTRTYFHYSDEGLVGEFDSSGTVIKTYGWKPGSTWSTDPLFVRDNSGEYSWYHNDHLGTPQMMTTSSGAVVWKAKYSSFGKAAVDPSSTVVNPLRFPGQYEDKETGMHYNWHRYYDNNIGRYLRNDPLKVSKVILLKQHISIRVFGYSIFFYLEESIDYLLTDLMLFQGLFDSSQFLNDFNYTINNPLCLIDPFGLYSFDNFINDAANFSAGFGDLISFGITKKIRQMLGTDYVVDKCSGAYTTGKWSGVVYNIAFGVAGGLRAAGSAGRGLEFSHWIPARWGGPRSIWNGNYVTRFTHALSDPYRYRFMPRAWKALNPMPNRFFQQWTRLPKWVKGAGVGAGYSGGSMAANN